MTWTNDCPMGVESNPGLDTGSEERSSFESCFGSCFGSCFESTFGSSLESCLDSSFDSGLESRSGFESDAWRRSGGGGGGWAMRGSESVASKREAGRTKGCGSGGNEGRRSGSMASQPEQPTGIHGFDLKRVGKSAPVRTPTIRSRCGTARVFRGKRCCSSLPRDKVLLESFARQGVAESPAIQGAARVFRE